ncbi:MAG TPA: hypothetical protein PKC59_05610 [Burkholderiaceae bacterium]|uniref:hypothetical protein n=1 Tax=Piscinibacter sp. TaxID=1903157 RepID=UPI0011D9E9B2|nr:MAG: hypothetical protein E6Q93_24670 [Burkholderiaceae bacterium]HMW22891.1 hypothetical protein [Burkholderiaceae bacterium]HNK52483.1 hypothetical protein [Ottowia sp.]HNL41765.1 hypothetical protein [Ottowia sp.]HNN33335.1 hypothetical protein [Ottowia sp.]
MTVLTDVDVLRDVAAGRVPPQVARRDKLVALRAQAMDLVREQGLLQTRASWRIVPLDGEPGEAGSLCMDGQRLQAPWLVPSSGRLTAVACAVATIGDALEQHVGELFAQRRAALGVALDSLGNELLFALSRRVQDRLWAEARKQGLTVAGELRAGDPGLQLQAQHTVLQLAGAADIGVALTRTLMMNPTKSTSIVQGVGLALPVQTWSRCDHCRSRERCNLVKNAA